MFASFQVYVAGIMLLSIKAGGAVVIVWAAAQAVHLAK